MFLNNNGSNNNTNIDSSFNKSSGGITFDLKKILIILLIIVVLIVGIIIIVNLVNNSSGESTLTLNGGDISIYKNNTYVDLGYVAVDSKGNDISSKVKVESNVNSTEIGEYTVTYKLGKKSLVRKVNVVNKGNVTTIMTLNGESVINLQLNDIYDEKGVTVLDSTEKDLNDRVIKYGEVDTSKKGTYRLVYTFVNSEGVMVASERMVTVK